MCVYASGEMDFYECDSFKKKCINRKFAISFSSTLFTMTVSNLRRLDNRR